VLGDFASIEVGAEVGVFEGVVVGEGDFADVVGGDEGFVGDGGSQVLPAHSNKINGRLAAGSNGASYSFM